MAAKFTKGPATVHAHEKHYTDCVTKLYSIGLRGRECGNTFEYPTLCTVRRNEDANLIAAAFNAATEMEEMGYNGQASLEMLKEMYEALEKILERVDDVRNMRSEYGGHVPVFDEEDTAIRILAKARGGDDATA